MTEQPPDRFESDSVSGPREADSEAPTPPERLESLLVDTPDKGPVDRLAEREVKAVDPSSTSVTRQCLILLLLCLATAGLIFLIVDAPRIPVVVDVPLVTADIRHPVPKRTVAEPLPVSVADEVAVAPVKNEPSDAATPATAPPPAPLYSVLIGPFLSEALLTEADALLVEHGLQGTRRKGRGPVPMIRLLKGVYPATEAERQLLSLLKVVKSAFSLPSGAQKAIYAGSFADRERAQMLQEQLARKGVPVELVTSTVDMMGTQLVALKADRETAEQFAAFIEQQGYNAHVIASD